MKLSLRHVAAIVVFAVLALPPMIASSSSSGVSASAVAAPADTQQLRPVIPGADRYQEGKVFLEHADTWSYLEQPGVAPDSQYQVLTGNVVFRKNDMFMYCDSAHFYEAANSFDAFSNVRMEQGDTLFVYADELEYSGVDEMAVLYAYPGKKVRLINRDVKLSTDVFNYDLASNIGFYNVGGVLDDAVNRLRSLEGEYHPDTKYAYFYYNVDLEAPNGKDTLRMYTDSLVYNTGTHLCELIARTRIVSADGEILSSSGKYNTLTGLADLYRRSLVITNQGNTLTGDTLFYDRNRGIGEAFGDMVLMDSARKSSLHGDYGWYNELSDSAFVTGRALAKEYSGADTLYLHGDTIYAYVDTDSSRVMNVYRNVRFFRSDMQGICDSLSSTERDSLMHMYHHPVVWSGRRQVFGNIIEVHVNDSTVDWARLPEFGFTAEHIAEDCYQQMSASEMTTWFNDSTISRLYAEGNVMLIMFPMESDSTYNKYVYVESSEMDAYFRDNDIESVHFRPATTGKVTPLYLAKRNSYFLQRFAWYEDMRPVSPDDVFEVPQSQLDLMRSEIPAPEAAEATRRRKEIRKVRQTGSEPTDADRPSRAAESDKARAAAKPVQAAASVSDSIAAVPRPVSLPVDSIQVR